MIPLLLPLVIGADGPGTNLLVNGDFSAGAKGFVTGYKQSSSLFDPHSFTVIANPRQAHEGGASFRDHSGKGGLMLALNGSEEKNVVVWQSTVKVSPQKKYTFSGWAASWGIDVNTGAGTDPSPAMLRVFINGKPTGAVYGVNAKSGNWGKFTYEWSSGSNTTATIRIVNANVDGYGNDFALDDLFFGASAPTVK